MDSEPGTPPPSREISEANAEKNLPPPAPLSFRTLAFLADSVLVLFATALLLKLALPAFCPEGVSALAEFSRQLTDAYARAAEAAAAGRVVSADAVTALAEGAAQDEALISLFETAYVISFAASLAYFVCTEQFLRGQTLGKKIFGLRTVFFGTTLPPPFLLTLSRSFWKAISIVPSGWLLTLLAIVNAHVVVFAKRHRGWHDKLARTEVVDARRAQDSFQKR